MGEDFCKDHSSFVEKIGQIAGKMDMMLKGQDEIKKCIDELYSKFNSTDKDNAVQKTKLAPVFWVIVVVGGYILVELVKGYVVK
jgi:hypothetical protein